MARSHYCSAGPQGYQTRRTDDRPGLKEIPVFIQVMVNMGRLIGQ
jgi:hypothetical protein